jgi:hypothetical protein
MADNETIPISCDNPKCRQETQKTIAWLKANDRYRCPICDTEGPISGRDEFLAALQDIKASFDEVAREFARLNKRQ